MITTHESMNLEARLQRAIQHEIEEIVEEEAKEAAKRCEDKVKKRVAAIAANVCHFMDMQRFGSDVRITLRFEEPKERRDY